MPHLPTPLDSSSVVSLQEWLLTVLFVAGAKESAMHKRALVVLRCPFIQVQMLTWHLVSKSHPKKGMGHSGMYRKQGFGWVSPF